MDTKTLCLAVLSRGEASGYEIKKALEDAPFAHIQEPSFGSIYPALGKLAEEGLVEGRQETQTKRPDKKVYRLTEAGWQALERDLRAPPPPDRYRSDFLFVVLHARLLDAKTVARLIDERIAFFRERLAQMAECDLDAVPPERRFVHGFGRTLYQAAAAYLEENRERFIAEVETAERQAAE